MMLGAAARFAAHFVSGIVFFGSNAPAGTPVWAYSALYNLSYVVPSLILSIVAALLVLPVLDAAVPVRASRVGESRDQGASCRSGTGGGHLRVASALAADVDFVVAVDGGGRVCLEAGVLPDIVMGDFDSLSSDDLDRLASWASRSWGFLPRRTRRTSS